MAARAYSTPRPAALLRTVPMSLWPEAVLRRRKQLQSAADRASTLLHTIVAKLDLLDGDADFEPVNGSGEITNLRTTNARSGMDQRRWAGPGDEGEREPDPDWEPSLGSSASSANVSQEAWARGGGDDLEQDDSDREPSLGASEPTVCAVVGVWRGKVTLNTFDPLDQSRWATIGRDRDLEDQCDDEGVAEHCVVPSFASHHDQTRPGAI